MNAITTQDANVNPLVVLNRDLETRAAEFKKVLPAHIKADKFQRTIITAVQLNPDLLRCDRRSLITAAMKAAQDGLLPDGREAALVKFTVSNKVGNEWIKTDTVAYMPMVYGLRKKILQSGEVADISANVVYRAEVEEGLFIYEEGSARALRHRPKLDLAEAQTADSEIVAAYSMATMKDGTVSYEVMRRFEIEKVRGASQTGSTTDKFGKPRQAKGPWVDWFGEMAKKSVMRRHSKTLPMSGDILLDVEGRDQDHAATSAVDLLDSTAGGEPRRIEATAAEEAHDPVTGELQGPVGQDEPDFSELDEQTGTTRHPSEDPADALIAAMRDAKTIIDLNSAFSREKANVAAMPDEIATVVHGEFARLKAKLGGKVAAPANETVDA